MSFLNACAKSPIAIPMTETQPADATPKPDEPMVQVVKAAPCHAVPTQAVPSQAVSGQATAGQAVAGQPFALQKPVPVTSGTPAKPRLVPILPKHIPAVLPRAVPLAPRPAASSESIAFPSAHDSPPAGPENGSCKAVALDDDEAGAQGTATDKPKRAQRTRTFTEEDDLELIRFWNFNLDLYTRCSKLSFSRRTAEYLNTLFASGPCAVDRTPTHEKQVHNKICYLVRRYEFVLHKYAERDMLDMAESVTETPTIGATAMQLAESEFPYFAKMHSFLAAATGRPASARKRKMSRSSSGSLPDVVIPDEKAAAGRASRPSYNEFAEDAAEGETQRAKARKIEDSGVREAGAQVMDESPAADAAPKRDGSGGGRVGDADMEVATANGRRGGCEGGGRKRGFEGEVYDVGREREKEDRDYELRKQEILLRSRDAKRLEADLKLRQRDFESRHQESLSRTEMQRVHQLRESAKIFFEIGMPGNGNKCMDKVAELLKL